MLIRTTLALAVKQALAASATAAATDPSPTSRRNASRLAGALATTLIATTPAVFAQSTGGSVFGQAASGDTVIVEGEGTGFRREISVGADGSYRVPALSPGKYKVTLRHPDGSTAVRDGVLVSAGTGTPVSFTSTAGVLQMENIIVTGVRVNPIDVSSVESVTVLSADQLAKIPVLRDLTSAALLAPGAVRGDFAFADGKLPSFGGSSVAENQYYVNGFNVTNSFRGLNFSKIPFEAIAEQQVKTGGYGAEFGRSLGGVVSQTTKRGTNDFQSGSSIYWSPASLRSKTRNANHSNRLEPSSFGTVRSINAEEETSEWTANVWASGALLKDKLFAFGLIGYSEHEEDRWGNVTQANNTNDKSETPSWLVKLDWHINDANSFELTGFSDEEETTSKVYLNTLGAANRLGLIGTQYEENGGTNVVGKYTSYISDSFTVSALYGHGEYSRALHLTTADGLRVSYSGNLNTPASGCPVIVDARPKDRRDATGTYASTCNITATFPNAGNIERQDARDERNQFRVDAEWKLGAHLVRFGYDLDDFESVAGESIEGGRQWRYSFDTRLGRDVVREQIVNQGATVEVKQRAFYIEDNWNITENFLFSAGLRWDSFENLNGQGETYVEIDNQFGPRLGFSWDVKGDSSMKLYGNAGRYALPLTASVAIRGASASLFTREDYFFTAADPVTGVPLGLQSRDNFRYVNGEFGEAKNAQTIASKNLDPMYQDEFILGMQMRITSHQNVGARAIYRELKAAIDDNCDYTPILTTAGFTFNEDDEVWVDGNGREAVLPNGGFPYCRMFNPGENAVFLTDFFDDGTLTQTTVAGDLLSPKARRTYKALELFWDGNWDKTFVQASYTLAYSKGNTEGGVKSDIGQDDTNVTQDFDYKELAVDSYGYLPNDRRHSFKVFGSYSFTDEFAMGTNLVVQSGRPKNCLGVLYPYHGIIHPYGSSFFRCGTTTAGGRDGPSEPMPRGTAGRLPWTYQVDLSFAYTPHWAEGLTAKMDVFNIFNKQEAIAVDDRAEDAATGTPVSTYLVPRAFQSPREFQFSLVYNF